MKQFWINLVNWFKAITPWVKFAWEQYQSVRNAAKEVKDSIKTEKALTKKKK